MSTLLIRNVQLDGNVTNILIEGNRFANLTAPADTVADETYDASGLALVPSFFNTHTHASMTLLRGYADDLPLFPWLNDHIWPFEGKMRAEDIYAGANVLDGRRNSARRGRIRHSRHRGRHTHGPSG